MSRFVSEKDIKTIRAEWWGADEEVVIRVYSWGQKRTLEGSALEAGVDLKDVENPTMKMKLDELANKQMEFGIVSWTFADDNGNLVPVNRKNIGMLYERDGEFILKAIDDYNSEDVEKK